MASGEYCDHVDVAHVKARLPAAASQRRRGDGEIEACLNLFETREDHAGENRPVGRRRSEE